jgi:hypothetical protein
VGASASAPASTSIAGGASTLACWPAAGPRSERAPRASLSGRQMRTQTGSRPTGRQPTLRLWELLISLGSPNANDLVSRRIPMACLVRCEFTPLPRNSGWVARSTACTAPVGAPSTRSGHCM